MLSPPTGTSRVNSRPSCPVTESREAVLPMSSTAMAPRSCALQAAITTFSVAIGSVMTVERRGLSVLKSTSMRPMSGGTAATTTSKLLVFFLGFST